MGFWKVCKRCRWWEEHNVFEGFCRLEVLPYMEEFAKIGPRVTGGPKVWAKHDEVRTSPDFGCNQWEKRK